MTTTTAPEGTMTSIVGTYAATTEFPEIATDAQGGVFRRTGVDDVECPDHGTPFYFIERLGHFSCIEAAPGDHCRQLLPADMVVEPNHVLTVSDPDDDECRNLLVGFYEQIGDVPAVGALVKFTADSPQFARNAGTVFQVIPSPTGEAFSMDNTDAANPHPYVWLVVAADVDLPPSRRRTRSARPEALQAAR